MYKLNILDYLTVFLLLRYKITLPLTATSARYRSGVDASAVFGTDFTAVCELVVVVVLDVVVVFVAATTLTDAVVLPSAKLNVNVCVPAASDSI